MVPLRDKLHVLTLNAHSLLEWDTAFCLETMTDAILREEVDILVLQEVNQGIETAVAEQSELEVSQFMPCEQEVPIKKDNYALAAAKLLQKKGGCYSWTWAYAHRGYDRFEEGEAVFTRLPVLETDALCVSTPQGRCSRKIAGMKVQLSDGALWCYSVHMGWWKDKEDPFAEQWAKLRNHCAEKERCLLMGDFNSPAHLEGEGYSLITADGWQDAWRIAKNRDEGITVGGKIDGWREGKDGAMRIDFAFLRGLPAPDRSRVIFNDSFYPIISDHYGVLTEW